MGHVKQGKRFDYNMIGRKRWVQNLSNYCPPLLPFPKGLLWFWENIMGKCFKISLSICEEPSPDMVFGMLMEQKKQNYSWRTYIHW